MPGGTNLAPIGKPRVAYSQCFPIGKNTQGRLLLLPTTCIDRHLPQSAVGDILSIGFPPRPLLLLSTEWTIHCCVYCPARV